MSASGWAYAAPARSTPDRRPVVAPAPALPLYVTARGDGQHVVIGAPPGAAGVPTPVAAVVGDDATGCAQAVAAPGTFPALLASLGTGARDLQDCVTRARALVSGAAGADGRLGLGLDGAAPFVQPRLFAPADPVARAFVDDAVRGDPATVYAAAATLYRLAVGEPGGGVSIGAFTWAGNTARAPVRIAADAVALADGAADVSALGTTADEIDPPALCNEPDCKTPAAVLPLGTAANLWLVVRLPGATRPPAPGTVVGRVCVDVGPRASFAAPRLYACAAAETPPAPPRGALAEARAPHTIVLPFAGRVIVERSTVAALLAAAGAVVLLAALLLNRRSRTAGSPVPARATPDAPGDGRVLAELHARLRALFDAAPISEGVLARLDNAKRGERIFADVDAARTALLTRLGRAEAAWKALAAKLEVDAGLTADEPVEAAVSRIAEAVETRLQRELEPERLGRELAERDLEEVRADLSVTESSLSAERDRSHALQRSLSPLLAAVDRLARTPGLTPKATPTPVEVIDAATAALTRLEPAAGPALRLLDAALDDAAAHLERAVADIGEGAFAGALWLRSRIALTADAVAAHRRLVGLPGARGPLLRLLKIPQGAGVEALAWDTLRTGYIDGAFVNDVLSPFWRLRVLCARAELTPPAALMSALDAAEYVLGGLAAAFDRVPVSPADVLAGRVSLVEPADDVPDLAAVGDFGPQAYAAVVERLHPDAVVDSPTCGLRSSDGRTRPATVVTARRWLSWFYARTDSGVIPDRALPSTPRVRDPGAHTVVRTDPVRVLTPPAKTTPS